MHTYSILLQALNIITAPSNMDSSALIVIYAVEILNTTSRYFFLKMDYIKIKPISKHYFIIIEGRQCF